VTHRVIDHIYPRILCGCGRRVKLGGGHPGSDVQYGACSACGFRCKASPIGAIVEDDFGSQRLLAASPFRVRREAVVELQKAPG
jgi:hypothetical protein